MDDLSDLPNGPSGRRPLKAIDILDYQSKDSRSLLVLFDDGAMGKWADNTIATSDGSDYTMIFYSNEQFGKINIEKYNSKKEKYFLNLQLIIYILSLASYIFIRGNSEFPSFIPSEYNWIVVLIFIPNLFFFWAVTNLFSYTDGDIVVHIINSDPHYFTTLSSSFNIVKTLISNIIVIQLICFYFGYYEASTTFFSDILVILLSLFLFTNLYLRQPIGEINDFIESFRSLHEEINKQKRVENPLLKLLMANESQTLEFKSSLWTQYNESIGMIVKQQTKKMLELEDEVVKTIAAFLNTDGGTLLIGVRDKPRSSGDAIAEIRGVEPDFKWLKKKDVEGYTHALIQIFDNAYSNPLANHNMTISFPEFDGKIICRIDVEALPRKVGQQCYTKTKIETEFGKSDLFFTRTSDTTKNESPRSQYGYIRHHFEGFSGENNLEDN